MRGCRIPLLLRHHFDDLLVGIVLISGNDDRVHMKAGFDDEQCSRCKHDQHQQRYEQYGRSLISFQDGYLATRLRPVRSPIAGTQWKIRRN